MNTVNTHHNNDMHDDRVLMNHYIISNHHHESIIHDRMEWLVCVCIYVCMCRHVLLVSRYLDCVLVCLYVQWSWVSMCPSSRMNVWNQEPANASRKRDRMRRMDGWTDGEMVMHRCLLAFVDTHCSFVAIFSSREQQQYGRSPIFSVAHPQVPRSPV